MEYNAFRSLLDGLAEQWNDAFSFLYQTLRANGILPMIER